jgi:hypothetical protein
MDKVFLIYTHMFLCSFPRHDWALRAVNPQFRLMPNLAFLHLSSTEHTTRIAQAPISIQISGCCNTVHSAQTALCCSAESDITRIKKKTIPLPKKES